MNFHFINKIRILCPYCHTHFILIVVNVDGVMLCLYTTATSGPVIHSPGEN
jgi:hypothetical protein